MQKEEYTKAEGQTKRYVIELASYGCGMRKGCLKDLIVHYELHKKVSQHSVHDEKQEILVVVDADAVADPRTVMIEPGYTLAADRAVMRTGWPEALTLSAVSPV